MLQLNKRFRKVKKKGRPLTSKDEKTFPDKKLLRYIKIYDDVFESLKSEQGKTFPLLICQTRDDSRNGNYILRVNKNIMDIPQGFTPAVEIMIKLNILLSISFPKELNEFYDFILGCIMQRSKPSENSKCFLETLEALS